LVRREYGIAPQPTLFTIRRNGKQLPAVAVGSKTGNLFLLNQEVREVRLAS
jgi:quinoprotein glucose dehydrogenase